MSDTGTPAVDEDGNPIERPAFSEEQETYMTKMFEKQSEQLTSHFGRIVAKQLEEKVMPKIEKQQVDATKINEELSTKMFGGDVNGTVREIITKVNAEEKDLAQRKQTAIETEMEKFTEAPFFKETQTEIAKLAKEALNNGYPPAPAVELAVEKAKANYLLNRDPEYKLSMSGPGKQIKRKKKAELPAAFKAQAEKDIRSGLFKDEAEYMANLSPSIKERYGL